ncbi:MAG: hypothetical protein KF760_27630 [Candidatus Eremiobacteraeota bacterium]|nr:hypothetical protein [Candidatus Eremiobacteraeota bacterium]MCW5871045.1 hypothetical protein [Candidatus Eremiobacteraeota bacterium]
MKPPFGQLPKAEPRFRRPIASAVRRKLLKSLLHMTFLFVWILIMLVCTPAGSWLLKQFAG